MIFPKVPEFAHNIYTAGIIIICHNCFLVTVDGEPIGYKMWQHSKYRRMTLTAFKDNPLVSQIQELAHRMINYDPDERPSAEEVLREVGKLIIGNNYKIIYSSKVGLSYT